MEKYKKEYKNNSFENKVLFEGKYTWEVFEHLYLGDSVNENYNEDINKSYSLNREFGELVAPENTTINDKLTKIGKFFKTKFGWNITYIKVSKENNRIEFTIDGKIIPLPNGCTLRIMGGGNVYGTFSLIEVIKAKNGLV